MIVRVSDSDPEMLRYLTQQGIAIGDQLHLTARQPFDGPIEIRIGETAHSLGSKPRARHPRRGDHR
jgi:DtxR family Mn-dependent transcriptional regulator